VGVSVGVSEFVCDARQAGSVAGGRWGARSAGGHRSRESPTQPAARWSLTLTLPLTRTLADLRGELPGKGWLVARTGALAETREPGRSRLGVNHDGLARRSGASNMAS